MNAFHIPFRRLFALLCALTLLSGVFCWATGETVEITPEVRDFAWYVNDLSRYETLGMNQLLTSAWRAEGDPVKNYQGVVDYVVERGLAREFLYELENAVAGAKPSEQNRKISEYVANRYVNDDAINNVLSLQEEGLRRFADPGAQTMEPAAIWEERGFEEVFGVPFSKFKPSRPRPGLCLAVIKRTALYAPGRVYTESAETAEKVLNNLKPVVGGRNIPFEDNGISFTGNPNLASFFMLYDIQYSFYGTYGSGSRRIKGYRANVIVTAMDALTHKKLASLTMTHGTGAMITIRPGDIYENGIYCASLPTTSDLVDWKAFTAKMVARGQKQDINPAFFYPVTEGNAALIASLLASELETRESEPWRQAVYAAGAREATADDSALSFKLRAFNPNLEALGPYEDDPGTWLDRLAQNASTYALECSLPLGEDGRLTQKGVNALQSAVKKAASASQKAFGSKAVLQALQERFFPAPIDGKAKSPADILAVSQTFVDWVSTRDEEDFPAYAPEEWAPLFYAQKKQALLTKGGPHALALKCVGIDPLKMMKAATRSTKDDVYKQKATATEIRALFVNRLAETALQPGDAESAFEVALDVDELLKDTLPVGYLGYLNRYAFGAELEDMEGQ